MIRRRMLLGGLCVCAGLLSGGSGLRNYMLNRMADATDMVRLDVSAGLGTDMGFHVMVTKLVRLEAYSIDGIYRAGFSRRCLGIWTEDRESWAVGLLGSMNYRLINGHWVGSSLSASDNPEAVLTESGDEIGLGAHLFIVGVRVGVRPWQILDFITGLVGIDIAGDDLAWEQRNELRRQSRDRDGVWPGHVAIVSASW